MNIENGGMMNVIDFWFKAVLYMVGGIMKNL